MFAGQEACQILGFIDADMLGRNQTGILSVRWVDRFVVVIPAACILLIVIGWSYAARRIDSFTAYLVFVAASVVLAGFPYFWEQNSSAIAAEYSPTLQRLIESSHSVEEFKLVGVGVAVVVGIAGLLALLESIGALGVSYKIDRLLNPELVDPGSEEFGGTIFERRRQNRPRK